jgi:hypothetical protein
MSSGISLTYTREKRAAILKEQWSTGIRSRNPSFVHNIPHSADTRKKMSERTLSDETKKKISVANSGRLISDEHKKKLSMALSGKQKAPFTEAHKHAMSVTRKNIWNSLSYDEKKEWQIVRGMIKGHCVSDATRKTICNTRKLFSEQKLLEIRQKLSIVTANNYVLGIFPNARTEYKGIKMRSEDEKLFAEWLDAQGIAWEYQPLAFKMPDGFHYIPDFRIVELGEYVEVKKNYVSKNSGQRYVAKMDSFVYAGNILHVVVFPFNLTSLSEETLWRVREIKMEM